MPPAAARPFAAIALLLLVPLSAPAGGCAGAFGGGTVANDTPERQLVREATAVNLTAKAAYAGVRRAHRLRLISDARLVQLEPYIDAVEAGRRELTRVATAGEADRFPAVLSALNVALGELAAAQLDADTVEAAKPPARKPPSTRPAAPAPLPAVVDDSPAPPPPPYQP